MDEGLRQQVRQARGRFLAMGAAYSLGAFNDNFFKMAAILLAMEIGWHDYRGYATVIFALPFIVLAGPCGWLADRFPKRNIVIGAKLLELVAMTCGAIGIVTMSWPLITAMIVLMASQSAIFSPALNGSIPELFPAEYVARANGYVKLAITVAILLGVTLAGAALAAGGELLGWRFTGRSVVAGVVLLVAAVGVVGSLGVPRRPAADPRVPFPWNAPVETARCLLRIRRDRLLWLVLLTDVFVWSIGALEILVIALLKTEQFALGDLGTGLLMGVLMIGVSTGGLIAGRALRGLQWHRPLPLALAALAIASVGCFATAFLPAALQVPALHVAVFFAGLAGGFVIVTCESFIQIRPGAAEKGQVIAAANAAVFAGILMSGLVANLLGADLRSIGLWRLRPTDSFAVIAAMSVVAAVALSASLRSAGRHGGRSPT